MTEYNGGLYSFPGRENYPKFFRAQEVWSGQVVVKAGQVLKQGTFLETDTVGKAIAHSGMNEKALVTFVNISQGHTIILGGLTFTAGASGCSKADLVKAFTNLPVGITAANANIQNPVGGGSFTAGTLTAWRTFSSSTDDSVVFVSATPNADVTNLAATGTGTPPTITVVAVKNPINKIAGVLQYDVDASEGDVEVPVYTRGSFYASWLKWDNNHETDYVTKFDGTKVYCTDYFVGATTDALKVKFVEDSSFRDIGIVGAGEQYL